MGYKLPRCLHIYSRLALQLERRKTRLVEEYHLLPLVCRSAFVIYTLLQPLLDVDSGKQSLLFHDIRFCLALGEQVWSKLDYSHNGIRHVGPCR